MELGSIKLVISFHEDGTPRWVTANSTQEEAMASKFAEKIGMKVETISELRSFGADNPMKYMRFIEESN